MNKKTILILFVICCLTAFASDENKIIIRNILRSKEYLEMEHRKIVDSEEELDCEIQVSDELYSLCKQFKMDEIKMLPKEIVSYCAETNEIKKGICWHKGDFVFDYKRLEKLNGTYLEPQCSEDDFSLHKFKNGKLYSRIYELGCVVTGDSSKLIMENYFTIEFNNKKYLVQTEEKFEFLKYYSDFSFEDSKYDYMAKVTELNIQINIDNFPNNITDEVDENGVSKKEKYCKEIVDLLIEDYIEFYESNSNFDFEIPITTFSFKFKDDIGKQTQRFFRYTYSKPINYNIGSEFEEIE